MDLKNFFSGSLRSPEPSGTEGLSFEEVDEDINTALYRIVKYTGADYDISRNHSFTLFDIIRKGVDYDKPNWRADLMSYDKMMKLITEVKATTIDQGWLPFFSHGDVAELFGEEYSGMDFDDNNSGTYFKVPLKVFYDAYCRINNLIPGEIVSISDDSVTTEFSITSLHSVISNNAGASASPPPLA